MMIRLHRQATTTPKIRAVLQASNEPASTLAKRYGISELTVSKWKKRNGVEDHSHMPHSHSKRNKVTHWPGSSKNLPFGRFARSEVIHRLKGVKLG